MIAYLACFDISDDRIRYRVGKELNAYGNRVQRSVFEITLDRPEQLEKLRNELLPQLQAGDDLRFYSLCEHCRKRSVNVEGERLACFPAAVVL